ncbi:MAG TPA: BON domain-containing protein [Candidatus Binataceae bacterium]|nr:BON domain-containing protein [Candidatus Binataceae bacterium]
MPKTRYGILLLGILMLVSPTLAHAQGSATARPGALGEAENAIDDAALTTKVKTILATNKVTSKYKLHVSSSRGVVTLSGHIGSLSNAHYAVALVRKINSVRGVRNHLQTP